MATNGQIVHANRPKYGRGGWKSNRIRYAQKYARTATNPYNRIARWRLLANRAGRSDLVISTTSVCCSGAGRLLRAADPVSGRRDSRGGTYRARFVRATLRRPGHFCATAQSYRLATVAAL